MLNRPVLNATATERPVIMSGVARNSILPRFVGLKPKVSVPAAVRPVLNKPPKIKRMPSHALAIERSLLVAATISTMTQPTAIPIRIERMEARMERAESVFLHLESRVLILHLPLPHLALRRTCTSPALGYWFVWGLAGPRFVHHRGLGCGQKDS